MTSNERAAILEERLIDFAVQIVALSNAIPNSVSGRHFSGQIVRSGSAPALLYDEARGAESNKDFKHKMSIALKELRETYVNQRIIVKANLINPVEFDIRTTLDENNQLISIFNAAVKSLRESQR
ncbi:MAG: four helix bundle protein [Bacteroidota bacterium]